jgi:hypothetical protein
MSWKSVNAELIESITQQAAEGGMTDAAIVALIGAADSFTMSTNPASDPTHTHHPELNETSGRTAAAHNLRTHDVAHQTLSAGDDASAPRA